MNAMNSETKKLNHECAPENAARFAEWITKRGGVAIWPSVDLGDLGSSWSTPGDVTTKPTWRADSKPARVITDATEIDVVTRREVKRIRIAIERGSGLSFNLTQTASKRLRKAVHEATLALQRETGIIGPGATYYFDGKEAVITVPGEVITLAEWISRDEIAKCACKGRGFYDDGTVCLSCDVAVNR